MENIDCIIFVRSNSSIENLLFPGLRIKVPGSCVVFDNRNWRWPVLRANVQGCGPVRFNNDSVHLVVMADEVCDQGSVGDGIAGMEYRVGTGAQNASHRLLVTRFHGFVEGQRRLSRRSKRSLTALLWKRDRRKCAGQKCAGQ